MSEIHNLQQQCKQYKLDIDLHHLFNLWELVRELKAVLKRIKKIGKDYSYYLSRYNTLKSNADELGITISEPLRNPSTIKKEIANIFTLCGFNDKIYRDAILEWMGLSDNVKNLPRVKKKITTKDDGFWWDAVAGEMAQEMYSDMSAEEHQLQYEQEMAEMEQHETDLINYYNSKLK